MNHIYFTALVDGAGLAAALAKGDGVERVFMVEPTGNKEPHMQSLLTLVLLIASVSWNNVPWKQRTGVQQMVSSSGTKEYY